MSLGNEIILILAQGLEFGLLNALMVCGMALALRFGGFPDLTIEGTVPLSASVAALSLTYGASPLTSILMATACGMVAGSVTAGIHLATGMSRLLASIVVMTALYAVSLRALNGSNLTLFEVETWYSNAGDWYLRCARTLLVLVPLIILLVTFLHTEFGLLLRASGENWKLIQKLGKPCWLYLLVTLAIANGLVGASGGLIANYNRFADVGFGAGTIVTALAALLIGETILTPRSVTSQFGAAILGSVVYSTVNALALRLGFHPWDLKLVSAGFVMLAVIVSRLNPKGRQLQRIGCDPL